MKIRDYLLVGLMIFAIVWFMQPTSPGGAVVERPFLAGVVKIAKQLGWFFLILDEPPVDDTPAERYMDFPDALVKEANQEPPRIPDADGVVHVQHGEGW
jgi:hypothetical protein